MKIFILLVSSLMIALSPDTATSGSSSVVPPDGGLEMAMLTSGIGMLNPDSTEPSSYNLSDPLQTEANNSWIIIPKQYDRCDGALCLLRITACAAILGLGFGYVLGRPFKIESSHRPHSNVTVNWCGNTTSPFVNVTLPFGAFNWTFSVPCNNVSTTHVPFPSDSNKTTFSPLHNISTIWSKDQNLTSITTVESTTAIPGVIYNKELFLSGRIS